MKRSAIVLGTCALAIGVLAAAPNRPEGQPFPYGSPSVAHRNARDKAYDLVGGRWKCLTYGGTSFWHQYSRGEDAASLVVLTDVKIEGKPYTLKERYQFHHQTKTWSVSLAGGEFTATAGLWTGRTWVFNGVDTEDDRTTSATMTYDFINGNTFRRTFARDAADGKKTYTGERCVRVE